MAERHDTPRQSNGDPLVRARGLCVRYDAPGSGVGHGGRPLRVTAVAGVDLDIGRGQTFGLVGESGCGKTTLGRALLRLVPIVSGSVAFDGVDVHGLERRALRRFRRRMQMVFQDPAGSLNPWMTVSDIVGDPLRAHGLARGAALRARVGELLESVGLDGDLGRRYPYELSGGQRQRVGIARAMAPGPEFLVCDEPISALDVAAQADILALLARLRRDAALSYLFITHNLAVAEGFCDTVGVMYLGKLVEIAAAGEIFHTARHPYTQALRAAVPTGDPAQRGRMMVLPGEPPSAVDPPAGCAFHPRCPHATERCRQETPRLESKASTNSDHRVACHHADELWSAVSTSKRNVT
jgi:oligopeptide/dipeptide ABC transporter ATP-binding protein